MSNISNLAFVHPEAKIGKDVTIEAFAYIDRNVELGDGCIVRSHASILSGARIGKNNHFYEGCIIAATPQDFRWKGDESYVVIGDNNCFREQVIVNRSIYKGGKTEICSNSFLMAQTHISHDSHIGNWVVLGNGVKIAGSCEIGDYTILSSGALVHEKCHIGDWVLIKGGCRVNGNVPPFTIMAHNPIKYYGVNAFVMRKGNKKEELIDEIAKCYRHLYQCNTSPFNALRRMKSDVAQSPERDAVIDFILKHDYKLAALPLEGLYEY